MAIEINNNVGNGAIKGFGMQMGRTGMDPLSKSIQSQIANRQKEMQELSKVENMSLQDKMKKRQEIQKEIADLNNQLRQHQIEQRKEQQTKKSSMDDMIGGSNQAPKKSSKTGIGMSSASMQAIISSEASIGQIELQSSVKTEMKGKSAILKSEIQMDKGRGASTEVKEAELADTEKKIDNITSLQMRALSDINENIEKAAKEDSRVEERDLEAAESETISAENVSEKAAPSEQAVTHVDVLL